MAKQSLPLSLRYDDADNDHSADVLTRDGMSITHGRRDDRRQAPPSSWRWTFKGHDFNPANAASPLHGKVDIGTPIAALGVGEITALHPRTSIEGNDPHVLAEAHDITHRLALGEPPAPSAPHRFAVGRGDIVGYWPLDDPRDSAGARAVVGRDLQFRNVGYAPTFRPQFGAGRIAEHLPACMRTYAPGIVGTSTLGQLGAAVRTTNALWAIDFTMRATPRQGDDRGWHRLNLFVHTEEETHNWLLGVNPVSGQLTIDGVVVSGDQVSADLWDGRAHHIRLEVTATAGSDIDWEVSADGTVVMSGTESVGAGRPVRGIELSWLADVLTAPDGPQDNPIDLSDLMVWSGNDIPTQAEVIQAMRGYVGEAAGRRIERLCDLAGIPFVGDLAHDLDDSAPMGPQHPSILLELIREAADTDAGILITGLNTLNDEPALDYRPASDLYNQTPALVLDFAAGEVAPPLDPVRATVDARNAVTARDRGGREVTRVGAGLGTGTHAAVNASSPFDLGHHAGWRLHLWSDTGLRFAQVTVDLDATPSLATEVDALDLGDLIQIDNLPPGISPDPVLLMVQGWTQRIQSHRRVVTFWCTPGSVWTVGVWQATGAEPDPDEPARYSPLGSTTADTFVAGTDTVVEVDYVNGDRWSGASVPYDIEVSGARLRVTSVFNQSPGGNDFLTVDQAPVNGVAKTIPTGTPVRLWAPAVYAL